MVLSFPIIPIKTKPSSAALKPPRACLTAFGSAPWIWSLTAESLCRQLEMVPKSCWIFLQSRFYHSKLLWQGQATEEQPKRKSIFLCLFSLYKLSFLLPSLHSSTVKSFKPVLLFTGMYNVDCFFGMVVSQYWRATFQASDEIPAQIARDDRKIGKSGLKVVGVKH